MARPPFLPVTDGQTLVKAAKPTEPAKLPSSSLLQSGETWGVLTCADSHRSPASLIRDFSRPLEEMIIIIWCSRNGKNNFMRNLSLPPKLPTQGDTECSWIIWRQGFLQEKRVVSECLAIPSVQEAAEDSPCSPEAPRILRWDRYDLGEGEYWEINR